MLNFFCTQKIKYSELISFVNDRPGHDKRYSINSEKIQSKLNWYPKYSFDEALEITIKWYLENKEFLKQIQNFSLNFRKEFFQIQEKQKTSLFLYLFRINREIKNIIKFINNKIIDPLKKNFPSIIESLNKAKTL